MIGTLLAVALASASPAAPAEALTPTQVAQVRALIAEEIAAERTRWVNEMAREAMEDADRALEAADRVLNQGPE